MNKDMLLTEHMHMHTKQAPCPAHGNCDNAATLPSALATSSGQAAQMHALLTFMGAGDNFVCASELYGGTYTQFAYSFKQIGIEAKFADVSNLDQVKSLIDSKTKCIYIETLANPSGTIPDFDKIKAIAQEAKIPVVCDNTFGMGGYCCRPLKLGVDIVVESATKWLGGHGTSIGGIIVDGSSFNWLVENDDGSLKFPLIAGPQQSYHGAEFSKHPIFGVEATNLLFILSARVKTLRDMGGCISPFNAFQLIQGIETLSLRAKAHCENANALAAWLSTHPKVKEGSVTHPSLESHPCHEHAKKYFRKGCFGSVFCFDIKGATPDEERANGSVFSDNLKLAANLANVGDARTLVIHPASTTHQQLNAAEQAAAGVRPASIRVSVGYEDIEDIKGDFEAAFAAIK
jgi:O-acetylhomoserine/O-acetylserine sulfhydrylase